MSLLLPCKSGTHNSVRELLLSILHDGIEILGEVEERPDHVVHELRRFNKRARGLIRLFRHMMPQESVKKADRKVRDAAKCFSEARDSWVMVEVFESLSAIVKEDAFDAADTDLELRRRHQKHLADLQLPLLAAEVGSHFGEVIGMVKSWDWPAMSKRDLVDGLVANYRKGRKEFRLVRKTLESDHFHRLRRRAKYMSFHAGWLSEDCPPLLGKLAEDSSQLATLLGEHHDLAVFEELMKSLPSDFAGARLMAKAAEQRRAEIEATSLTLGKELYAWKAKKLRNALL